MTGTSFGQTFPPVAVLALAVPVLGFGFAPTILALSLYGLLPVVRNTVSGLNNLPAHVLEAARGMGMSSQKILLKIEIPLAARMILAGIRISVVINIGTAMIGATIGAGGLGAPVVAGLVQNNISYVVEGALPAALLAILVDRVLAALETNYGYLGTTT
jgi:osmoprotectant transport system permease protein